jgi:putative addiction module component (TIGR02574 family)
MTLTEIQNLSIDEKLQIMELIWEDLGQRAEEVPVHDWQQELLDSREKAVQEGRAKFLDWGEVKKSLLQNPG